MRMKKTALMILAVVMLFAVSVFAGTADIQNHGDEGSNVFLGVGYEEDGKYSRTVEFRPGSELRGEEVNSFRETETLALY